MLTSNAFPGLFCFFFVGASVSLHSTAGAGFIVFFCDMAMFYAVTSPVGYWGGFSIVQYDLSYAFWSEDHLHALPLAALSQM